MICTKCYRQKRDDGYKTCRRCREMSAAAKRKRKNGTVERPGRPKVTADEYEAMESGATGHIDYDRGFVDEWLDLCGRCSLDDCIRREGDLIANSRHVRPCAVYQARQMGITAKEALRRWKRFNLLPPEEMYVR